MGHRWDGDRLLGKFLGGWETKLLRVGSGEMQSDRMFKRMNTKKIISHLARALVSE